MKKNDFLSKAIAAMLLGGAFGWYIHHDEMRWSLRGRDAFIAFQAHRFDMNIATPHTVLAYMVTTALMAAGFCAVYELISSGVSSAIKGMGAEKID